MKNILALAACVCALAVSAYGQGTLNFNNRVTSAGLDSPVFDVGGAAKLAEGFAQLVVNGTPVGDATAMRTGSAAGYFSGGTANIASVAPGATASIQVRAWKGGATFETATATGISEAINVTLGGAGSPPSLPANLVGLKSFSLVPEPSTIALGLIGAAALMLRRRS